LFLLLPFNEITWPDMTKKKIIIFTTAVSVIKITVQRVNNYADDS
jgi:hypothetical protein